MLTMIGEYLPALQPKRDVIDFGLERACARCEVTFTTGRTAPLAETDRFRMMGGGYASSGCLAGRSGRGTFGGSASGGFDGSSPVGRRRPEGVATVFVLPE
jgi:hypothetical protein